MIIKFKNIAIQYLFQSLVVVIGVSLLLLIILQATKKKEEISKSIAIAEVVSVHLEDLNKYVEIGLAQHKTQPDFVSLSSELLIRDESKHTNNIIDSLNLLREFSFLKKHFEKNNLIDSLILELRDYNSNFDLLVLSLKEKGNTYDGVVGEAYKSYKILTSQLKGIPEAIKADSQLCAISKDYFTSLDRVVCQNLQYFVDDLSSTFYSFEEFDASTIDNYIAVLRDNLEKIEQIDSRIYGTHLVKGQIDELNSLYEIIISRKNELLSSFFYRIHKYEVFWKFIQIIYLVLFAFTFLLYINAISKRLQAGFKTIDTLSDELTKGGLEKIEIETPGYELVSIKNKLDDLRNILLDRKNFVEELVNDNFSRDLKLLSKRDNLSIKLNELKDKLLSAKNEQEKRAKDNEIRRYINEGLAKFADIMRVNSNDTKALGDNLIKELTKYLNALQGTLFLSNEEDESQLNLISAFAYDRKKYLTKTLKKGEGLIGTCAMEKKTIHLTDVPDDYIIIKSGLGDTPPNKILITPVIHDNALVGVIELASLHEFNKHEIQLTEQICSNLASTIITVRNNTQTALLLEKSQQQAAEMAEQEEEMRQNMEELKATQEESARREDEMQGILDAIGASFYVIEYAVNGNIEHINDKLVKFLNQPYESLIGIKHTEMFSSDSQINDKLIKEIADLKVPKKIIEELNLGSKKYIYSHILSPIVSKHEEVLKIINLLTIEEK
ncbi:MAG: GAF domain-containing protein [Bacteroidales bacterium]|nr:GAF domain-containing protein [Bacteroidales bacterium]MBN2817803.1 GAF domain-containing protein [Bacteroidales bacterium]